jgi:methionine-gamma-lyase
LLAIVKKGDHVISDNDLYGCTNGVLSHHLPRLGVEVTFVNASVPGAVKNALRPNTKVVYAETVTNPTLKVLDIATIVAEAHSQPGVFVIIDNTFCSPLLTRPIDLGADVVVHSMTKYLNGHSDCLGGVACGPSGIIEEIRCGRLGGFTGAPLSPFDAFLVIRGLQTLAIRLEKCSRNAQAVAEMLEAHPAVKVVYYPGLKSHPSHEIALKQMRGCYSGVITFELNGDVDVAKSFLDNLRVVTLAVSLGGCESLVQHPASMTHAAIPREERMEIGITDGMIRMSIGCEATDDLIRDLKTGLDRLVQG